MTEKTQARLNGANARALSRITGKSAHEEASKYKRTFDIVMAVRSRRYKWLGHILRLKGSRLVKLAVKVQYDMALPGNICMDAPPTTSFEDLVRRAQDRMEWARYWEQTHQHQHQQNRRGRWIGTGIDAVWMGAQQATNTNTVEPSTRKRKGRWIGTGFDAVWVDVNATASTSSEDENAAAALLCVLANYSVCVQHFCLYSLRFY